jgi:hypothetical protein
VAFSAEHGVFFGTLPDWLGDGDPYIAKDNWKSVVHLDMGSGNILLHWHETELLPQLILTDLSDAKIVDAMPYLQYDSPLRSMRTI